MVLLDAWDPAVQAVAWQRRAELFRNLATEEDPHGSDGKEPIDDPANAAGFGDEEPGIERDLHAAGVLQNPENPAATAPVSHEEACAFLDGFLLRLEDRMAAAKQPLPTAANAEAVIAEVTANAADTTVISSEEEDEDEDEDGDEDADEAEEEVGGAGACT